MGDDHNTWRDIPTGRLLFPEDDVLERNSSSSRSNLHWDLGYIFIP